MRLRRNYWTYSTGLLVVWTLVLAAFTAVRGPTESRPVYLTFAGFAIGWVSTTIARYVYPPPSKWTHRTNPES
jgi:hypothetical protein